MKINLLSVVRNCMTFKRLTFKCAVFGAICTIGTLPLYAEQSLPSCDSLMVGEAGAADCMLSTAGLEFSFTYVGEGDTHGLTVEQRDASGTLLDVTTDVVVEFVYDAPQLRDITLDGTPELFVPTTTGNVNVVFLVWQLGPLGHYQSAGYVLAAGIDAIRTDGRLISAQSHAGAAAGNESGMLLGADGFVPVYELEMDWVTRTCSFYESGGVVAAGLNPETILADCAARMQE
jgi:hypothetical protein